MVTMSMNIGGAETHILELCRELARNGDSVTLASYGGVYATELESYGIRLVRLPLNRKNPRDVLACYRGLKKLISEEQFDIVHAHARIPAFICGLLWDRLRIKDFAGRENARFRFVTTAHLDFTVNPLWRRISRWGEYTMAVSEDIADYLVREYGVNRDRISLTINGIDTDKFSPDIDYSSVLEKWNLDPSHRRIVYMSRMDEDRADPAFRLVGCAQALSARFPDTDLILVGGGGEEDRLRAEADRVNKAIGRTYVTVTGGVTNTNEYCAAADIFVGVSRSALEAMTAAKPVILAGGQGALGIFDESVIADAVETNFCCRGMELADSDRLLDDLTVLLSRTDSELEEMGRYNRAFAEERYTASRMADDYRAMYRRVLASPVPYFGKPDVTISGYYGFGNLGDESLLDIITSSLAEAIPGVRLAALTKNRRADSKRTGLRCVTRLNPFAVVRALGSSKLLLSGGGSLLQDTTSRRSLRYYTMILRLARFLGTKTAIYANGIGPIRNAKNGRLSAAVANAADWVSVRDGQSKEELIRLGASAEKIHVTADPAFLIKPSDAARLERIRNRLGLSGDCFFISIRPLGKRSDYDKPDKLHDEDAAVVKQISELAVEISGKYGLTPVFLPMQPVQDMAVSVSAAEAVRKAGVEALIYTPENAADLIGMLSSASFVIGMRLHAIIFASSAATPVVGLSYDPKVSALMAALDQPYAVSLDGDIRPSVLGHVASIIQKGPEIRAELAGESEAMRLRCNTDLEAVRDLLD